MGMDAAQVREQLDRICESQDFRSATRMKSLLRYLVEAELEGRGDEVGAYDLGVHVFARDESFDPNADSIVRVQVGRLRRMLHYYYLTDGRDDPVRMEIPKGAHRAALSMMAESVVTVLPAGPRPAPALPASSIPVAVLPFTDLSGDQSLGIFADSLCDELTTQLAAVASFSLAPRAAAMRFRGGVDIGEAGSSLGVDYIIDGTVRHAASSLRVGLEVIEVVSGTCVWARRFEQPADDPFDALDGMVASLAGDLKVRVYQAAQNAIRQKPLEELSAGQLAIRALWLPNDEISTLAKEQERVACARLALEKDPGEARAHAVLANRLAFLAGFDPPSDTADNWALAERHAQQALELGSADADVALNICIYYWHSGRMEECMWITRRCLALEPGHLVAGYAIDFIPFCNTLVPPAVLQEFRRFDEKLPPDSSARWVMQSWLCQMHLNNGDFESVVDYGLRTHGVFALPDIRYSVCAALDQLGNGDVAARLLRDARPDWPTMDIGHFASVTIRRRFGDSDVGKRVRGYYERLAQRSATGAAA